MEVVICREGGGGGGGGGGGQGRGGDGMGEFMGLRGERRMRGGGKIDLLPVVFFEVSFDGGKEGK